MAELMVYLRFGNRRACVAFMRAFYTIEQECAEEPWKSNLKTIRRDMRRARRGWCPKIKHRKN